MYIQLLFSGVFAIGVFILYSSLTYVEVVPLAQSIREIQEGVPENLSRGGGNPIQKFISQAQLDISLNDFLLQCLMAGVVGGGLFWVVSGTFALLPPIGALVGIAVYIRWLLSRKDYAMAKYEESIADLADRLGMAVQAGSSLENSFSKISRIVPEVIRPDVLEIQQKLSTNVPVVTAMKEWAAKRQFAMLEIFIQTLITWREQGDTTQLLNDIMRPLSSTLRRMSYDRERQEAELSRPRNLLRIAAVSPALFIMLFRIGMPAISDFFGTLMGQILLIISAFIAISGYWIGERMLAENRETVKFGLAE